MSTSIVDIFKAYKNNADGDYNAVATEYATLNIEWIKKIGNQVISADTSWGNATNDLRNLFVLVKGNLTVNAGYTLTAAARKRGMFIYVNGNCTVNGTISMTAKGASAAGARLLLCNIGGSYEVPAAGGAGGASVSGSAGNAGTSGIATGACGGGGSGAAENGSGHSGAGAAGTSYSGGPGGGGAAGPTTAGAGTANGGAGGNATNSGGTNTAGGGAGNPGGAAAGSYAHAGGNGTGGLLVLYVTGVLTFGASGTLSSIGAAGGNAYQINIYKAGGGGSGGGHIDYFYKSISGSPTITLTGGAGGTSGNTDGVPGSVDGGAGGAGSTRATQVSLPNLFKASNFFIFF